MLRYTIRRVLGVLPVFIGISLLIFLILRLIPGDPALLILGERATAQQRAALLAQLGLNKPLFFNLTGEGNFFDTQYFNMMRDMLSGNLGTSIVRRTPVATELAQRFPATIELTLFALTLSCIVGVTTGIIAAARRGSLIDTGSILISLVGVSIPVFWLGLMLQVLFGVRLQWLPISLRLDPELSRGFQGPTGLYVLDGLLVGRPDISANALKHLILPSVTLATVPMAIIARMTRSAMLEVLSQDYVRTAWAKGLQERAVVLRHGLRNALLPVVTIIGLQLGLFLGGAILTETIFSWPGIGTWIRDALLARDYPVVQGGIIFVALVFVIVNTLVDLSYAFLDPRIQYR